MTSAGTLLLEPSISQSAGVDLRPARAPWQR